ncbi:MAG: hypothetical protein CM1200mP30_19690 [Pseudomonadota bacterium]|nr:MAG: hypothetical protein CM1200mP30_19690 [Pseudomonadota bacterium]
MIYKLYKTKKKGWMVYDVDVLGVSIVQTYRSQFSGVLKKETMEQLMERCDQQESWGPDAASVLRQGNSYLSQDNPAVTSAVHCCLGYQADTLKLMLRGNSAARR